MCFGTGVIEQTVEVHASRPVSRRSQQRSRARSPGKQAAPKPPSGRLETAIQRLCRPGRPRDANYLCGLLDLLKRRVDAGLLEPDQLTALKVVLTKAAMCEKSYASRFFHALAREVRQGGTSVRTAIYDMNGYLKSGQSPARLTEDMVKLLVDAQAAQRPKKVKEAEANAANEKPLSGSPPAKVKRKLAAVEHLVVFSEGVVDPTRLVDCARFIERHKLRFVYVAGSKKAIRELRTAFTGIETIPVTNEANLAAIKARETSAVFNVAPKPVMSPV